MKKNLMTVLILALLVVNLILTGVMMFSVVGTNKKTAEIVGNIATVLNLELSDGKSGEEPPEEVKITDSVPYNIEGAMTIALKGDGTKDSYVMFNISLYMNKKSKGYKKYSDSLEDNVTMIKDAISEAVGTHTEAECRDNFDAVKDDILKAVQAVFGGDDFIYRVAISDIKYM